MQENYADKRKIFNAALGEVISKLRQDSKLSARTVACSIELSKTTLLLAEKGLLDPQLTTFCRIAEAYNLSPSKLLKMVENKLPENWSISE